MSFKSWTLWRILIKFWFKKIYKMWENVDLGSARGTKTAFGTLKFTTPTVSAFDTPDKSCGNWRLKQVRYPIAECTWFEDRPPSKCLSWFPSDSPGKSQNSQRILKWTIMCHVIPIPSLPPPPFFFFPPPPPPPPPPRRQWSLLTRPSDTTTKWVAEDVGQYKYLYIV